MKNKEIVTLLGLSAALSMTACNGSVANVAPVDSVAEVAETEEEHTPTEEPTPTPTATPTPTITPEAEIAEEDEIEVPTPDYTIEPIEDTTYYAIQTCNVRSGPSTDYDTVRQLAPNEEIIVNGRVKAANGKNWCVIKTEDGSVQMVSGSLISTEKIAAKKPSGNGGNTKPSGGNTGTVTPAPSDCAASDCSGDCEGFCEFTDCGDCDCFSCYTPADPSSYCAAAE